MTMLFGELYCLRLATQLHGSQTHGDRPFSCHLLDVAAEVITHKLEDRFPAILCAAFLHDTYEDTVKTPHQLAALREHIVDTAGCDVDAMVWAVTDSTEGVNRKERKANTYAKTREYDAGVGLKLCDRIANVKQCHRDGNKGFLRMYQGEHAAFREALYREGEFDVLWADVDNLVATEIGEPTSKRVETTDPLVFKQLQTWDANILRPTGPVHVLYEVNPPNADHLTRAFVDALTSITHAVCGVMLGEGAGPMRLRHMMSPSTVDDGHVLAEGVTCPDCLGLLEST